MNAYTRQDLSVMQAWPLERKIRVTQAKIIEWYHHYGGPPYLWTRGWNTRRYGSL